MISSDALRADEGTGTEPMLAGGGANPAVLFVVFQTGKSANGGVESITQVIERLRNVRPVVVTQMETPQNRRWRDAGAAVHVYPLPQPQARLFKLAGLVRMNQAIRRLVKQSGVRVVHCNDIRALWHAGPGARAAGASIIFNIRDVKPPQERYRWHWRIAQLADRILVLSSEMREELSRRLPGAVPGLRASVRIEHIYSIVDLQRMRPVSEPERAVLRHRLGIREGEFAIAYVAAVAQKKEQLRFLEEAAPLLRSQLPQARIHFVGDFRPERSEYAQRCLEAVRRLQIEDRVVFAGYSANIAEWYQACDATVLASRREGLARCMIESLACGTPVVSFDVCSAREILEQHGCGYVVPQGDYGQLVAQLGQFANDGALRARVGENAAAVARRLFDADTIITRYERVYASDGGSSRAPSQDSLTPGGLR